VRGNVLLQRARVLYMWFQYLAQLFLNLVPEPMDLVCGTRIIVEQVECYGADKGERISRINSRKLAALVFWTTRAIRNRNRIQRREKLPILTGVLLGGTWLPAVRDIEAVHRPG
jgi:hypothetical protein